MATLTLSTASPDIVYFVHGGGGRPPASRVRGLVTGVMGSHDGLCLDPGGPRLRRHTAAALIDSRVNAFVKHAHLGRSCQFALRRGTRPPWNRLIGAA